jgi:hypothetical protein
MKGLMAKLENMFVAATFSGVGEFETAKAALREDKRPHKVDRINPTIRIPKELLAPGTNMSTEFRRKCLRSQFTDSIRYSVTILDMGELKKIHGFAVCVDIGEGGLGMITRYPLKEGHVLTFSREIRENKVTAKTATIQWVRNIETNIYQIGLEFVPKA